MTFMSITQVFMTLLLAPWSARRRNWRIPSMLLLEPKAVKMALRGHIEFAGRDKKRLGRHFFPWKSNDNFALAFNVPCGDRTSL